MARVVTPVGLPDSSKGEEDFAARRRKEHARPVRSPTEFLREEKPPRRCGLLETTIA